MSRKVEGRLLHSRADLRQLHGISQQTLQNLWTDRANNGHPDFVDTIDGVMHWDANEWATWHHKLQRQRAEGTTTRSPKLEGDPEEMVGPAEAAKVCGFSDSATVSHYVKNPPKGWPAPDDWDELPTRRRPKWKRATLWQYLADRQGRGHAGGRTKGRKGLAYPYQGDERLALARQALAANPGAKNSDLIPQLQGQTDRTYSRPTWNNIIKAAREHPEE
ncbi:MULTISPECIES: hypothetical protein [unclassified Streptomyces]|uniref:hypothetical protein n=1 Tax=unclassified Streptomyces TaxID=2593676 RepID=UPI000823E21E|nr:MULTISPECIES: hypothetical protein [unclassified Streptomyces]SCK61692.1 hypothetical protein YUWDRAFT_06203 [Streptomyces sp. AmelKG-D3]